MEEKQRLTNLMQKNEEAHQTSSILEGYFEKEQDFVNPVSFKNPPALSI